MKIPILLSALALASASLAQSLEPTVTSRGPHQRTWSWTTEVLEPDGQLRQEVHGYTELADGLCFWDPVQGQYRDSEETIDVLADGAAALKGPCKVTFASDLHTLGAITIHQPSGEKLVTHPLGLAYFDPASGRRVLLAGIRARCPGELHPPNLVVYPDAFEPDSGVKGDIRYKYTRNAISQDIVLQSSLPDPSAVDPELSAEGTLVEIFSEFIESPVPAIRPAPGAGTGSFILDFGTVHIGSGEAFSLPRDSQEPAVPVQKRWLESEGRHFLIESVPWRVIQERIQKNLEAPPQASLPRKARAERAQRTAPGGKLLTGLFPLPPTKPAVPPAPMRLASLPAPDKGFVMDYIVTLNGSTNNATFASDTTYYVSGTCTLAGSNTVFEGGTVIKFTNGAMLVLQSTNLDFQGSPYYPVVFTARDDNTLGETVTGSTGNPTNAYGNPVLRVNTGGTNALQNLRIRYATTGLELSGTNNTVSHLQLLKVQTGVKAYGNDPVQVALRNVLAAEVNEFLSGTNLGASVEHLTLAKANFLASTSAAPTLYLTNSLLVAVTNTSTYSGLSNQEVSSITGVFQSVGAGQYYLATNSPYRDCGTTNINSQLLADLAQRTTYPPVLVSNVTYSADTTLGATVARHSGPLPLGYAYAPVDYLMTGVTIKGATLAITNGACLGISSSINLAYTNASSVFLSQGSPAAPNRIVETLSVQEQPVSG